MLIIQKKTASAVIAWSVFFYTLYICARKKLFKPNLRFKQFSLFRYTFIPFRKNMRLNQTKTRHRDFRYSI